MNSELEKLQKNIEMIWDVALGMGLDPFPTHFEIVPSSIMYEFGAYGLPGRFSHWTHGKAYHQMKTMYDYGLSKIYELVINTNPSYAFLLEGNSEVQNKLVIAHVLAHSDFFKRNMYYSPTSRHMLEDVSVHAHRIRGYEFIHGSNEVEKYLDSVLSIQEHVDPDFFIRKKSSEDFDRERRQKNQGFQESPYDDLWNLGADHLPNQGQIGPRNLPDEPEKDVLGFIAENSPALEEWQRDIIWIVRSEMLYFVPQMQTKVMNEGWASYWHARIMRDIELTDDEYNEFAILHSSVLAPSQRQLNPYYVGMKIFEDIEQRWNQPTEEEKRKFGRIGGEGKQKIFEVREMENDVSFLRSYITEQLVDDLDLYIYKQEKDELVVVEKNWERVRDTIVQSLTNFGYPYIVVEDGDYRGNRELLLKHRYEGQELDVNYADKTLHYVYRLWGRPVHIETVVGDKRTLLTFDGEKNSKRLL